MIVSIISRLRRNGIWRVSDHAELPQLDHEAGPAANHLLVLAGGLALTLSRCSLAEKRLSYPNATRLYALLRKELRQHGKTTASSELLLDAFHETSDRLDMHSKQAFKRCLDARMRYERLNETEREAAQDTAGGSMFTSFMPVSEQPQTSSMASTGPSRSRGR
jgi:hypothetical protein